MSDHDDHERDPAEIVSHLPTAPARAPTQEDRSVSPWVWVGVVVAFVLVAVVATIVAIVASVIDELDESSDVDRSIEQTVPRQADTFPLT